MDLFNIGQKIALLFQKDSNIVEMICEVEKIYDDRLQLVLPQYFMRYIEFLQTGQELTAKAFSKLGTIDFNTIIINSPLEEDFSIELDYNSLKLTPGSELPSIKTMENLEILLDKTVSVFKTFEITSESIKFYSDKKLDIGQKIDCSLLLPKDYGIINFKAIVTGIDEIYDNEYTAVYETISEVSKQTLLYYMYIYSNDID